MSIQNELQTKLKQCYELAQSYRESMKEGPKDPVENKDEAFDIKEFKSKIVRLGQLLSHNTTKFTIACKPPGELKEGIRLADEFGDIMFRMVGFYMSIPTVGVTRVFREEYRQCIEDCLIKIQHCTMAFMTEETKSSFMISTAAMWEGCENLGENLPETNLDAVLKVWMTWYSLIEDVKAQVHNDGIDEDLDIYVEYDETLLKIVDLTVLTFKKIRRRCFSTASIESRIAWLDDICDTCSDVSDSLDNLVFSYDDLDDKGGDEDLQESKDEFRQNILHLIDLAKESLSSEPEQLAWFEMCTKKLQELTAHD